MDWEKKYSMHSWLERQEEGSVRSDSKMLFALVEAGED
jgi:hypothetical protein